jgi:hypothetical protein
VLGILKITGGEKGMEEMGNYNRFFFIMPSNLPEDPNCFLPNEKLLLQHPQFLCRPSGKQIKYAKMLIINSH